MLCQSRLDTGSETLSIKRKFGSGSIFYVFASVACILIGKDGNTKKRKKTCENVGLSEQWPWPIHINPFSRSEKINEVNNDFKLCFHVDIHIYIKYSTLIM